LRDPDSGVDVGFAQANTTTEAESPGLVSLGTLFYEPLWIFCRCAALRDRIATPGASSANDRGLLLELFQKGGVRVSVGATGGATRPLALRLLALNGIGADKAQMFSYLPDEAAMRLMAGDLDMVITLAAWDAPVVQKLLHAPGIELMTLRRADAYVTLEPKFSKLVLPQGVVDLAADQPHADVIMIGSKASLVARPELHSALQYLLVRAAMEVHGRPAIFQRGDEFPKPEAIDLPISPEAAHVYQAGPSILRRLLPFWLAELLQRLLIILLPVAGILYPLWSLLPRFYRWQMQRRIFRLYGELRLMERTLQTTASAEDRARIRQQIEALERRVFDLNLPRSFSEMSFNLRMHIRALNERVQKDG
jgi:hypothetical protein